MSPLAAVLVAWCSVYVFAAGYYVALWARTSQRQPEHFTYGCMCLGLAIYSAGGVIAAGAGTSGQASFGAQLQYAGGFAAMAFWADFVSQTFGRPHRWVAHAAYVIAGLGLATDVSGNLLTQPSDPSAPPPVLLTLEPVGAGVLALALALCGWVAIELARAAWAEPDAWFLTAGSLFAMVAATRDILLRIFGVAAAPTLEHAAVIAVLAASYTLLRRYAYAAVELERRTGELGTSASELRQTQEQLVRKEQLAAVGELSAVIAHEVRNPLAIMKNAVSSLRRPTLELADRRVLLGILDEETDRLNRLVRDLLAYARPVTPRGGPVELEAIVRESFQGASAARPRTEVELVLELDGEAAALRGDRELLRHALVNIMDNSIQAMPAGGRLCVRSSPTAIEGAPAVRLVIEDDGEGMDDLVRAKALDPFFTTRPAGTGLGLAIVERVVKNHGGSLAIESAPGRGTRVSLTLPAG